MIESSCFLGCQPKSLFEWCNLDDKKGARIYQFGSLIKSELAEVLDFILDLSISYSIEVGASTF